MSLEYRVCLKESISRIITSADEISYPIELTEVLPGDEMRELLRASLTGRGFQPVEGSPQQLVASGSAGEQIVVDLEAMEVRVRLEDHRSIHEDIEAMGFGDNEQQAAEDARAALKHSVDSAEERLERQAERQQQKLTKALQDSEQDRLRLLNEVVQEAYAESLKRKAKQLGQVIEVQEGTTDGRYELTIKVAR